ncbi:MAG: EamA family transporter [Nitrospirae bacterium]|nr:EamA family transporter [Nitrospirota bacterium]
MEWVILSLTSAFFLATSDALAKKALQDQNEFLVAWFRMLFTLPVLVITLLLVPWPRLDADFYLAFFIALPIELITVILYIKALKYSPLSLTMPFMALTPVFLIIVSFVVLGEKVSLMGGSGIFLIAAGSYILNIDGLKKGLLGPLRAIGREQGSLFMIGVALLYSITSSMGKMAIEHSSPLFFAATYFIALNIAFVPIALFMGRGELKTFMQKKTYQRLFAPGICYALMVITHMSAMKLTKVAYMISVKRTSLLMAVLYGYFLFREENIRGRFFGASLMFVGFVFVVTAR